MNDRTVPLFTVKEFMFSGFQGGDVPDRFNRPGDIPFLVE